LSARGIVSKNRAMIALEVIEVQTGSYLAEDDIERTEDEYRRSEQSSKAEI